MTPAQVVSLPTNYSSSFFILFRGLQHISALFSSSVQPRPSLLYCTMYNTGTYCILKQHSTCIIKSVPDPKFHNHNFGEAAAERAS
jgi:hypothetical protein